MDVEDPPAVARRSPLLLEAYRFAAAAHDARSTDGMRVEHPVAVAQLLAEADFPDEVVAAALLHDVLEHTVTAEAELRDRFGDRVADLVSVVSENSAIEPYADRKAELRRRALGAGRASAAIFAADKLASARAAEPASTPAHKLAHYTTTLDGLRRDYPDLPFLTELHAQLRRLHPRPASA